jgi:MFS family permease
MTKDFKRNFFSFLWHALFLALAMNFMDVNTIIPTMLIDAGGSGFHLGLMTAIMIGGTSFMQLFFAGFLMNRERKKKFLITGIYLRVSALLLLGFMLQGAASLRGGAVIFFILFLITIFSFSGSFASVAYTDILGKSIDPSSRKRFFIYKQTISSAGILASALIVRKLVNLFDYPHNYSVLFLAAGGLLLVATAGFWLIRERPSALIGAVSLKDRFRSFGKAVKDDKNLRYYLLMMNASGLAMALMPFLIGLARARLDLAEGGPAAAGLLSNSVGNYLLLQISGMLLVNIIFSLVSRGQKYRGILNLFILFGTLLPPTALILVRQPALYPFIFLLSGACFSCYQIAIPGILLEITTETNRAVYAGIAGAGSIMMIIFPLTAGLLLRGVGYSPVFIAALIIIASGYLFSRKIVCFGVEERIKSGE